MKNSKQVSKHFRKTQTTELAHRVPARTGPWLAKRGTFWRNFRKKISQYGKNGKGNPLGFFNINSVAKYQKVEGVPYGDIENF